MFPRLDDWYKLPNVKDMFAMLSQDGCQRDTRQKNNLSLPKCLRVSLNMHPEHSVWQKEIMPRKGRVSHSFWDQKVQSLPLWQKIYSFH